MTVQLRVPCRLLVAVAIVLLNYRQGRLLFGWNVDHALIHHEESPVDQQRNVSSIICTAMSYEPRWAQWLQANYMNQENPPLFSLVADKVLVKDWVTAQNLGIGVAETYWNSTDPSQLALDGLPASYVIKSNHGSGQVVPVKNGINLRTKKPIDEAHVRKDAAAWLRSVYGTWGELWYTRIKPQVFIEEWIDDGSGTTPMDYKFHTIHHKVVLIQVDLSRFEKHNRHFYNRYWQRVEIGWAKYPRKMDESLNVPSVPKPPNYEKLVKAAEMLSEPFPYVRVDLFIRGNDIFFGELTFAHEGGATKIFRPAYVENVLGYMLAHEEHIDIFQNFSYARDTKNIWSDSTQMKENRQTKETGPLVELQQHQHSQSTPMYSLLVPDFCPECQFADMGFTCQIRAEHFAAKYENGNLTKAIENTITQFPEFCTKKIITLFPHDLCFVTAEFADSIDDADTLPISVKEMRTNPPRHFVFSNLPSIKAVGWEKIILDESELPYHRAITKSRWPKFLGWKHPRLSHCQVIFYGDAYFMNPANEEKWMAMAKQIKASAVGLMQERQLGVIKIHGPIRELNKTANGQKLSWDLALTTAEWLKKQPDFQVKTTVYKNAMFGYDPNNTRFQKLVDRFWLQYSKEDLAWRDQPLWAYYLSSEGMTPLPLPGGPYHGPSGGKGHGGHVYTAADVEK